MCRPNGIKIKGLSAKEAEIYAARWLPAWTGNNPARLLAFYTDDTFYSDPVIPDGINGKTELLKHFEFLLGNNPDWVWQQIGAIPIENGFLNYWIAEIPVGEKVIACKGVCTVHLRNNLIYRNEVFFDRSQLLDELRSLKKTKSGY